MMSSLWFEDNLTELSHKFCEQIFLVGSSLFLALLIGLPLGIYLAKNTRLKSTTLGVASIIWTIPSLALFAFFLPWLGIGLKPAVVVLALYGILPILRNTVSAFEGIPVKMLESAQALGLTSWQQLSMVELPLAWPGLLTGIRISCSLLVGMATLAAFIGAGGLGDFINQGITLNNTALLMLGAVPAAFLALGLDGLLGYLQKFPMQKTICLLGIVLLLLGAVGGIAFKSSAQQIIIGSKNFTEEIILAEIIAQQITAHTHLQVVRKFNLGTTAICHKALLHGAIDLYPEYTGTAYLTILNQTKLLSGSSTYQLVKEQYQRKFKLLWLAPFGFNDTQAIAIRTDLARKYALHNISDLLPYASQLSIGVPWEFMARADAFPGLKRIYGLNFGSIKQMDIGLLYKAAEENKVQVINAFSTDGRLLYYPLTILKDDKKLYPPYFAAPLVREEMVTRYPEIKEALQPVLGKISEPAMRTMNYQVDILKRSPARVAAEFIRQLKTSQEIIHRSP